MKILIALLLLFLGVCYPLIGEGFVERRFPYKLEDVLMATKFVKKAGYWEGYRDNRLVGYVMLSNDWTKHLVGYSSKPLETLIGMDTNGVISGVKIIAYSEPIFMIGIKDSDYSKFLGQYVGKNIKDNLTVGREITMDAITGATVSALVQNATILGSARGVSAVVSGTQQAVKKADKKTLAKKSVAKISDKYMAQTWDELVNSGAVKNVSVAAKELGLKGAEEVYIDLYFGIATPPAVGRNILGDRLYAETMKKVKDGQSALFVFARTGAFKGTGFAYGGIFGTINIEQNGKIFIFTTEEYENVPDIEAKSAPSIREGGVFIIKGKDYFDQTMPFKFNLTLPYYVGGKKTYKTVTVDYKLPVKFLK